MLEPEDKPEGFVYASGAESEYESDSDLEGNRDLTQRKRKLFKSI